MSGYRVDREDVRDNVLKQNAVLSWLQEFHISQDVLGQTVTNISHCIHRANVQRVQFIKSTTVHSLAVHSWWERRKDLERAVRQ